MKSNRKLKNYLIYPEFQLKFIWMLVFTNLLIVALVVLFSYVYFINSSTLYGVLQYIHSDSSTTFKQELTHFLLILSLLVFVFIALIAVVALVISHRVAGPVYKFKKGCEQLANGEKGVKVVLRPNDIFKDVAISFNKMIDKIT